MDRNVFRHGDKTDHPESNFLKTLENAGRP
jgi:hypothetical protein